MSERDRKQDRVVKNLVSKYKTGSNLILLEAPTGFGKTYVIAKTVKQLLEEDKNKGVIISTHTNKLAFDLLDACKNIMPDENIGLVFGKNNYIDINKLQENKEELSKYCNGIDKYIKKLKSKKSTEYDWLIDTFINETLLYPDMERVIKNLIQSEERIKQAKEFKDFTVSVTNHFYLLSNFLYVNENFNPDDYHIVLDEVHTIAQTADSLLSKSFSPFRLEYLSKSFNEELDGLAKKSYTEKLSLLGWKMRELNNDFARQDKVGRYFRHTDSEYQEFLSAVKHIFLNTKRYDIRKLLKETREYKDKMLLSGKKPKYVNSFLDELSELATVLSIKDNNTIGFLKFSQTKGYPSLIFSRVDAGWQLSKKFWKRKPKMIGVSATIKTDNSNTGIPNVLGFRKRSDEPYIPFILIPVGYSWGKVQRTYMPDPDVEMPEPPNVANINEADEDAVEQMNDWGKHIAGVVADTFENKKSIVLTGSYAQVDTIVKNLKPLVKNGIILQTTSDRTMSSILKEFTTDDKIKILVAARHFGVGIDLPGSNLEKLYIARLPYPVLSFKWLSNKHIGSSYIDEMVINFRQWMGRLIRTENDRGDLYILDGRFKKEQNRLMPFIKERSAEINYIKEVGYSEQA